jgi:glycosyltransferase involved in cell wall biosynthesis
MPLLTGIIISSFLKRDFDLINRSISFNNKKMDYILVLDVKTSLEEENFELEKELLERGKGRLRIIQGLFGNPGAARNKGLEMAEGKYVTFWDSDDVPNAELIFKEVSNLDSTNEDLDLIVGQFVRVEATGKSRGYLSKTFNVEQLLWQTGIWRIVYRKKFLDDIQFPELRMAEDQVFLLKCLFSNPKMIFSDSVFYEYIRHYGFQLTKDKSAFPDIMKAFETSRIMMKENTNQVLKHYAQVLSIRQLISAIRNGQNELRSEAVKKLIREFELSDLWILIRRFLWIKGKKR